MMQERVLRAPPLGELPIGGAGQLFAWEKNEADGTC